MDQQKVATLAKSLSKHCKQIVKDNKWMQKVASPTVTLLALTVLQVIADEGGKRGGWTGGD